MADLLNPVTAYLAAIDAIIPGPRPAPVDHATSEDHARLDLIAEDRKHVARGDYMSDRDAAWLAGRDAG